MAGAIHTTVGLLAQSVDLLLVESSIRLSRGEKRQDMGGLIRLALEAKIVKTSNLVPKINSEGQQTSKEIFETLVIFDCRNFDCLSR